VFTGFIEYFEFFGFIELLAFTGFMGFVEFTGFIGFVEFRAFVGFIELIEFEGSEVRNQRSDIGPQMSDVSCITDLESLFSDIWFVSSFRSISTKSTR